MCDDPRTMTLAECRIYLARSVGIKASLDDPEHPYPATLTDAADAFIGTWAFSMSWSEKGGYHICAARHIDEEPIHVTDLCELTARYRVAVWQRLAESKRASNRPTLTQDARQGKQATSVA